jgi:hypothetical protein
MAGSLQRKYFRSRIGSRLRLALKGPAFFVLGAWQGIDRMGSRTNSWYLVPSDLGGTGARDRAWAGRAGRAGERVFGDATRKAGPGQGRAGGRWAGRAGRAVGPGPDGRGAGPSLSIGTGESRVWGVFSGCGWNARMTPGPGMSVGDREGTRGRGRAGERERARALTPHLPLAYACSVGS